MEKSRNILVTIAYVGTAYHGFQIQQNAVTVQQVFQEALGRVLGARPDIKGCSRTDAGVHALEYGISFFAGGDIAPEKLQLALNFHLPKDIRVLTARVVSDDFHARYSCVKKRYCYRVWNAPVMNPFLLHRALHFPPPIDERHLADVAACFVGTHDFAPFSGNKRVAGDTVRTVHSFEVARRGDEVVFSVEADGFLYNMVRVMSGALLSAARGKLEKEEIGAIFKSGVRPNTCFTAPAEGLYLERVYY